jgi:K+/H+ antiporter YhaU regulatory subunit KhtT
VDVERRHKEELAAVTAQLREEVKKKSTILEVLSKKTKELEELEKLKSQWESEKMSMKKAIESGSVQVMCW